MKKESLKLAKEIIIESMTKSNIDKIDAAELMINIYNFLNQEEYEENIKILSKNHKKYLSQKK